MCWKYSAEVYDENDYNICTQSPYFSREGVSCLSSTWNESACHLYYLVESSLASVMSCVQQMLDAMKTLVVYFDEIFR